MQLSKEWHEVFDADRLKFIHQHCLDEAFTAEIFGKELNREQFIEHDLKVAAAFSDNKVVVDEQIADEQTVVSVMTWTAIHRAELYGIPASGKPIQIKGVANAHFL